jgi:hypothetical protein
MMAPSMVEMAVKNTGAVPNCLLFGALAILQQKVGRRMECPVFNVQFSMLDAQ